MLATRSTAPLTRRFVRALQTDALHFKCTQCGKCCTGHGGRVRVNEREKAALQRALGVSRDELTASYLMKEEGSNQWLIKQTDDDAQCIFLKAKQCSVYKARPTQCRTFPWWPQHLVSQYDWQLAARQCEGITPRSSREDDVHDREHVLREAIVYDIHRSGENYTYDELHEMLRDLEDVDTTFLDAYESELREKFRRDVVYRDDHVTVLDTFIDGVAPSRCFVFNDRLQLVQSEINFAADGKTLDPDVLVLDVHRAMAIALSWLPSRKTADWRIAVLGSGGGSLVRYMIHKHADTVAAVDAVEPNAIVNDVARRFFGMDELQGIHLHQEFGEDFMTRQQANASAHGTYDLVMIDVEAGTPGDGVLAPPKSMLTEEFLTGVQTLLSDIGVVAINVITENDRALRDVAAQVSSIMPPDVGAVFVKLPKNTVIFLIQNPPTLEVLQTLVDADGNADKFCLCPLTEPL